MNRRILQLLAAIFLVGNLGGAAHGQTEVFSPRDSAILQVRAGKGELHFVATVAPKAKLFQVRILDSTGAPLPGYDWMTLPFPQYRIDTIFLIPISQSVEVQWTTDAGILDHDLITGLAVGHIYGIAGQSNAQGWSPQPYVERKGDVRMMTHHREWVAAADPTGEQWGSPWIAFANKIQYLLNDGLPIGIINTAVGGTTLSIPSGNGQWLRNEEMHADTLTLYGSALTRFIDAGSDLEALFWIQGESDVVGTTIDRYQSAFEQLHADFEQDLRVPVRMFHIQIGGQGKNPRRTSWGVVREALRTLEGSTLVASTIGLPLSTVDLIHYSSVTASVVGERFAAAVASELYGIQNGLFPPLLPGAPKIVPTEPEDPQSGWKIQVQCFKQGKPCKLHAPGSIRGFQLSVDASLFDTALVDARINSHDSSILDLFLTNGRLQPNPTWRVSYAITADVSNASVSDGDSVDAALPNMLVAFLNLFVFDSAYEARVGSLSHSVGFSGLVATPNPTSGLSTIPLRLSDPSFVTWKLFDPIGRVVRESEEGILGAGIHLIELDCHLLESGTYICEVAVGAKVLRSGVIVLR